MGPEQRVCHTVLQEIHTGIMGPRGLTIMIVILSVVTVGCAETAPSDVVPEAESSPLMLLQRAQSLVQKAQAPQQDWEQVQGVSESPVTSNVPSEQPLLDALEGEELLQKPKEDWEQVQGVSESPVTSDVPAEDD